MAGIAWIGQTYLFNWMEARLVPPEGADADPNIAGNLWMVHGGGFYCVEKQKEPKVMPRTLYWFKWEAMLTWLSGVFLLTIYYYVTGFVLPFGSETSLATAIALGIGTLVGGWFVYDNLWRSPLGKNEPVCGAISFLLILAVAYGLGRIMSTRSVFIHIGAMFGTIMVANVWLRILPGQSVMLEAVKAGKKPDMTKGSYGARCSKHNTLMSVPLIFLMLSSHYPMTFGSEYSVLILAALLLVGFTAAGILRSS